MSDGPLSQEELKAVRVRLRKMSAAHLIRHYEASLQMCQLDPGKGPPSAAFVQQLVQTWRELVRRRQFPFGAQHPGGVFALDEAQLLTAVSPKPSTKQNSAARVRAQRAQCVTSRIPSGAG